MSTTFDNPWRYVITDPTGTEIGDVLNAHDRKVSVSSNGLPSASFTVAHTHPMADKFINDDLLLKIYRGTTLVFHGIVVAAEETATETGRTMNVTAAGAWWRASRRFIPASRNDNGYTVDATWFYGLFQVTEPLIRLVNAESFTGVRTGDIF